MRSLQSDPHSPATQPYNQGAKSYNPQMANNTNTVYQANPRTPSPQYGVATGVISQNYNSPRAFEGHTMIQSRAMTPEQGYNPSNATMATTAALSQHPATPTQGNEGMPKVVTPISNQSYNFTQDVEVELDDYFNGPPMGTQALGSNGLQDLNFAVVPNAVDNQCQGITTAMVSLTVRPNQARPGQQPYQNYSPAQAHFQQSPVPQQPGLGNTWNMGGQQQQQHHFPGTTNWNDGAQPQPQQQPVSPNNWGSMNQQQQQHAPHQIHGCGNHLPTLDHSPQAPSCGGNSRVPPMRGSASKNADDTPHSSINEDKSSVDVIRERGAGARAIRLLEETATKNHGYYDDDDSEDSSRQVSSHNKTTFKSWCKKIKLEHAKIQQGKQLRKLKQLEYKNRKPENLAESSRRVTPRAGYDPELSEDKCQLDFDRQREAQNKALKMMSIF